MMSGPSPDPHELSVGQLAARSGVAVSALHFYEAQGLISAERRANGYRSYSAEALVAVAQALGR